VSGLAVSAPVPYRITREKKYGDRMVFLEKASPTQPFTATVRFTVRRREVRVLDPAGDVAEDDSLQPVLGPDARVPVGGRFQTIARRVTQGRTGAVAEEHALFDHVVATMHYDYHHRSPEYAQGDAAFVCDYKAGNCSDLHSYLISLSRSLGVPAILEFGFPLTGIPTPDTLPPDGTITGYHCWVWFRDPKRGWVPLDAADARRWQDAGRPDVTRSLFGDLVLDRGAVAMSRGRDIVLSPAQKGAPLNYFISPYAEADGTPTAATWTLTYHLPTGGKS
jgi:transglutaminase-like putative cysteine protease